MHGTEIRVMRIFNTYGPRMLPDDGRVVSNFIVQALKGEPLTLYGDGSQTRSFCYVDELVEGMIRLMNGSHTGREYWQSRWVHDPTLAELACSYQSDLSLIEKPLPADDRQRQPLIDLAIAELDWQPTVSLEQGQANDRMV